MREENQTLATITLQNFFRLYEKLAGMTGTAVTEDAEFREIYNLPVVVIPPNRADGPRRPQRPHLPQRGRQVRRGGRRDRRAPRPGPAVPGGHHLDRELGAARKRAQASRHPARGPERQVPRDGSAHHRAGGPQGRRHHRHQHGRPRHRHHPRRQPRLPRRRAAARARRAARGGHRGAEGLGTRGCEGHLRGRAHRGRGRGRACGHRHRAPRLAPHRQPASRPFRAPGRPGPLAVLPLARRRPHAPVRRRQDGPHQQLHGQERHPGRHAHPGGHGLQGDRERAAAGGGAELRLPQVRARVRRRDEQAAPGDLRRAQRDPRRQGHPRPRGGDDRGDRGVHRRGVLPGEDLLGGVGLGRACRGTHRGHRSAARGRRGAQGRQPLRARRYPLGRRSSPPTRRKRPPSAASSCARSSAT